MTTAADGARQFSLRTLLLLVFAAAVLAGVWRAFGGEILISVALLFASTLPAAAATGSWQRAYALSWLAVLGPFLGMATYTLMFVSCSHCQGAAWALLPCAPGILPVELVRGALDLPRGSDVVCFTAALLVSAAIVVAGAWLMQRRPWGWGALTFAVLLLYSVFAAIGTLAMIRA